MAQEITSWAERFLNDIKERQINTIIGEGITGRAMSRNPCIGLLQLLDEYAAYLGKDGAAQSIPEQGACAERFGWLAAEAARQIAKLPVTSPKRHIVDRIHATSLELQKIAESFEKSYRLWASRNGQSEKIDEAAIRAYTIEPEIDFTPEERAVITKAWEIGTGTVAMQTTVGIEGDLMLRIDRRFAGKEHELVHAMHERAVKTSIDTWNALVGALLGVVGLKR